MSRWLLLAVFSWSCTGTAAEVTGVFDRPQFAAMKISPDGRLVVVQRNVDEFQQIEVVDIDEKIGLYGISTADFEGASISRLEWADSNSLIIQLVIEDTSSELIALHWRDRETGPELDALRVVDDAVLVDPLVGENDVVLFSRRGYGGIRLPGNLSSIYNLTWDESKAFRLNIDLADLKEKPVAEEIARRPGNVVKWLFDHFGELRAVNMWTDGEGITTFYKNEEDSTWFQYWHPFNALQEYSTIGAIGDNWVYVIGRSNRDTDAIYKWQVVTDELIEIFSDDRFDVAEGIFNPITRELIGLAYFDDGVKRYVYLDENWRIAQEHLEKAHGDKVISVVSRAYESNRYVYVAYNAERPGAYFLYDEDDESITKLGDILPGYDYNASAETKTGYLVTEDNFKVTYFLTSPQSVHEKLPLIVLPHGGPFGIQDVLSFQPLVQYLAQNGFAVLRINYRGSSGQGASFMEAGAKQWGRGIEDDIDATVDIVLKQHGVDPSRVAIFGLSYGGYSSLISIIRRPDRYRCAVSFAGPTDLPLLFTSSDWTLSADVRDVAKEIIGDPETEYEDMMARSPVAQVAKITRPLFLIQGDDDSRVDVEHYWRMLAELERHGKDVEALLLEDVGHGIFDPALRNEVYGKVVEFLNHRCWQAQGSPPVHASRAQQAQ